MTISVRVTNTDSRPGAVISVKAVDLAGNDYLGRLPSELNGGPNGTGEGQDFIVCHDRRLVISEVRQP